MTFSSKGLYQVVFEQVQSCAHLPIEGTHNPHHIAWACHKDFVGAEAHTIRL